MKPLLILIVFLGFTSCVKSSTSENNESNLAETNTELNKYLVTSKQNTFKIALLENINKKAEIESFKIVERNSNTIKYNFDGIEFSSQKGIVYEILTKSGRIPLLDLNIGDTEKSVIEKLGNPSTKSGNALQYDISDNGFVLELILEDGEVRSIYEGPMN